MRRPLRLVNLGERRTGEPPFSLFPICLACRQRRFPAPPAAQFRVELDGDATVADFAWPERKVLVFIDGMSETLHGNPRQRQRDRLRRAKARLKGYQTVEIAAQALADDEAMAVHFEELAPCLRQGGDH